MFLFQIMHRNDNNENSTTSEYLSQHKTLKIQIKETQVSFVIL